MKLKNFPLYEQSKGFCGPTSLRMVLEYYGIKKTEKELVKLSGATEKKGCNGRMILKTAGKLGFKARIKDNFNIEEIKKLVKRKIPVIVNWWPGESDDGHYSVIIGFNSRIIMAEPITGKLRRINSKEFEDRWFDYYANSKTRIKRRAIIIEK
jgi:ABC-type bacteriocin/lantibiotic exporter with double-glycine peptidase domain